MIYEALSEEECYLLAIIQDESGLDLAEFSLVDDTKINSDGTSGDGCFRAYPYQVAWWRSHDQKQVTSAARSVGKSLSVQLRAFAFPFNFTGEEMVIAAPESNHLDALTDNIENIYTHNRLAREMLHKGRSGIKHRPFMVQFYNGSRIMGRIPQRTGIGFKGLHPIWLETDEAQDISESAWIEVVETVKIQNPAARWRVSGVTRGVGDSFDEKASGHEAGWKVHRLPALLRPNWTEEEKEAKIEEYGGSTEAIGYRRNVLGLPGDMNAPLFVLHRLMACAPGITEVQVLEERGAFPARISTQLSDLKEGDVLASDGSVVECIFPSYHQDLLKVSLGGEVLYVTPEHRFFTDRGWAEASDLTSGDSVFSEEALRALQQGDYEHEQASLFEELLVCFERGEGQVL